MDTPTPRRCTGAVRLGREFYVCSLDEGHEGAHRVRGAKAKPPAPSASK